MLTAEQIMASHKANIETLFGLTSKAFEGVEKLVELNVQASKAALAEAAAQMSDLRGQLKAATNGLATANATISTLQAQAITSAMALKTAQDSQVATQVALDGALSASATLRASLAAIETQAAQARAK